MSSAAQLPPLPAQLLTSSSLDALISSVRSQSMSASTRVVLQQPRDAYLILLGPRGGATAALTHALLAACVEAYDETVHLPCQRDELFGLHYACIRFNRLGGATAVAPEDGSATGGQVINERRLHIWTCAGTACDAAHVASSVRGVMKEGYTPPAPTHAAAPATASSAAHPARGSAPHTPARGVAGSMTESTLNTGSIGSGSVSTPAAAAPRMDAPSSDTYVMDALSYALCHAAVYVCVDGGVPHTLHLQLAKYLNRAREVASHLLQGVPTATKHSIVRMRALDTRSFHAFTPLSSATPTPSRTPRDTPTRPSARTSASYAPYRDVRAAAHAKAHALMRSSGWPFPLSPLDSDDLPAPHRDDDVTNAPSALIKCLCIMKGAGDTPLARLMTTHVRTVSAAAGMNVLAVSGGFSTHWADVDAGGAATGAVVGVNPLPGLLQVAVSAALAPAHSHAWSAATAAAQAHIAASLTHACDTAETSDVGTRVWDFMPSAARLCAPLMHTLSSSITPSAAAHACTSAHSLILRVLVDTALAGACVPVDVTSRHIYKRVHEWVHSVADAAVAAAHTFSDTMEKRVAAAQQGTVHVAGGGGSILPAGLSNAPVAAAAAPVQDTRSQAPRVVIPSGETLARFKSELATELACTLALHVMDTALRPLLPANGQPFPPSLARSSALATVAPVSVSLCVPAGYDTPALLADETVAVMRGMGVPEGDATPLSLQRTHDVLSTHAAAGLAAHSTTLIDASGSDAAAAALTLHSDGEGGLSRVEVYDVLEEHPLFYLKAAGLPLPAAPPTSSLLHAPSADDSQLAHALRMDAGQLMHALVTAGRDASALTWSSLFTRVAEQVDTPTRVTDADDDMHTFLRVYEAEVRDAVAAARATADAILSRAAATASSSAGMDSPAASASMSLDASRVSVSTPAAVLAPPVVMAAQPAPGTAAKAGSVAAAPTGGATAGKDAKAFFAGLKTRGATTRSAAAAATASGAAGSAGVSGGSKGDGEGAGHPGGRKGKG